MQVIFTTAISQLNWNGLIFGIYKIGCVCEIKIISGALTSAIVAYQTYNIGIIAHDFIPRCELAKNIIIYEGVPAKLVIATNGAATLIPYAALAKGYTPLISETYTCQFSLYATD